jgi:chorismate synthase
MSQFGRVLRTTLFGESHGAAVGALVVGMPPGVDVDEGFVQAQLDRRRPGQSAVTTQRKESDKATFLGGVFDGATTGAPLVVVSYNEDKDSSKYDPDRPRPGHSDLAGRIKFFGRNDWRGAGHFGGRLTFGLVAMGAVARLALARLGTRIVAYTEEIGGLRLGQEPSFDDAARTVDTNDVRCPDAAVALRMREAILTTRNKGDSLGGVVRCRVQGAPAGLGGYHQDSFESRMAAMLFGIPAVKGVGFGLGFDLSRMKGSQSNDPIGLVDGQPQALGVRQGGTVGGVTDGGEVSFSVAFKPTSSLLVPQESVDLSAMKPAEVVTQGRHDPCIVPRAVPVVENAAALVVLDMVLERLGEKGFHEAGRAAG